VPNAEKASNELFAFTDMIEPAFNVIPSVSVIASRPGILTPYAM
jgi:hypothetical protein